MSEISRIEAIQALIDGRLIKIPDGHFLKVIEGKITALTTEETRATAIAQPCHFQQLYGYKIIDQGGAR